MIFVKVKPSLTLNCLGWVAWGRWVSPIGPLQDCPPPQHTSRIAHKDSHLLPHFCLSKFALNLSLIIRARWEIKNQNWDLHTWILMGNWILNLIYFLQFFDSSTPSAAKMRFYFLHFLQGKNAQNRPENQQNWNLAKIRLKSDNFMK